LSSNNLLCWICGERPADGAEHKVKASDIRSVCRYCNNAGTQVYDEAWRRLSSYLHANWRDITARGSFDLSKVFGAETAKQAIRVQLYFVNLKAGAPVREPPGFPWHPMRQRKLVKLSPYKGDTEPLVARRDLRI
jgi:hypothetical protein